MEILELMASKICHDLISPIGAVNNGIEFMEDMGAEVDEEIANLIAFSAQQASAKLQAFRMAYGMGGSDGHIKVSDVHKIIESIVSAEKKVVQDWDPSTKIAPELPPKAFCKILISTLLLAMECLPKGGALCVESGDDGVVHVTAKGPSAGLRTGFSEALALDMEQSALTPTVTHAYITGLLARHYDYKLKVEKPAEDTVIFYMELPLLV